MTKVDSEGDKGSSIVDLMDQEVDYNWGWKEEIDCPVYDLQGHVKENFLEVFDEPSSYKDNEVGEILGGEVIRKAYKTMFVYVTAAVYYFFAVVVGFFLTIVWAIVFGINQFVIVWVMQPVIKVFFTWLRIVSMVLRASVRLICDPWFQAIGQMFSFVRGRFRLNVQSPHFVASNSKAITTDL